MKTTYRFKKSNGFTLIELMIAIAILAIIMGIAIPSYTQYVLKSGRADAKGVLMQTAQTLERCYTRYSAYDDSSCSLSQGSTVTSENEKYTLTVTTLNANDYLLTAEPEGGQTKDTECGNFTLNHQGQKGANGGTDASDIEECW